jgi:hydrophobic/amphiphilic exporter-1 (mainly G- bacteria), HAE1 family
VMLTSITTVAGVFPIILETSSQAQVLIPMAASLVFGLMTGTLLILVLVPVFFQIYGIVAGLEKLDRSPDDYEQSLADRREKEPAGTH